MESKLYLVTLVSIRKPTK